MKKTHSSVNVWMRFDRQKKRRSTKKRMVRATPIKTKNHHTTENKSQMICTHIKYQLKEE
jgi:hypothetical protein